MAKLNKNQGGGIPADFFVNGVVNLNYLPSFNLSPTQFSGSGTTADPLVLNPTFVSSLGSGTAQTQLAAPVITLGTATSTTQPLSVAAVPNATSYIYQISADNGTTWTTIPGNGATNTATGLTAATSYQHRAAATANGYTQSNWSAVVTGSTAAAAGGTTLTNLTSWTTLQSETLTSNNLKSSDPTFVNNGQGLAGLHIPSGGIAIVRMQCLASTLAGEVSTGSLAFAVNTNLYGPNNYLLSVQRVDNGKILGRAITGDYWETTAGSTATNCYTQLRTDGTNAYVEYSNTGVDGSWIIAKTIAQPTGVIYIQNNMNNAPNGAEQRISNVQYSGLVP